MEDKLAIRTMAKDLASVGRTAAPASAHPRPAAPSVAKKAIPPASLPVADSVKPPIVREIRPAAAAPLTKKLAPSPTEVEESDDEPEAQSRLRLIVVGALIAVLAIGGGFFYWWSYLRAPDEPLAATHYECRENSCVSVEGVGSDACLVNEDCLPVEPTEPVAPSLLILAHSTTAIELAEDEGSTFLSKLRQTLARGASQEKITAILIKLVSPNERRYADLDDLTGLLGIKLAPIIASRDYTLFAYTNEAGYRLGLVINFRGFFDQPEIESELALWESQMEQDLAALLLAEDPLERATEGFQDNLYREVRVRYLNFPTSDLSIDYAIFGDKLIIAGSRETMYAALDALFAEQAE